MTGRRTWTAGIFLYVALLGALLQIRGTLLPNFGETFAVTEGQLGLLASAGSVGFLVTVLAVGTAVGRIDVKRTLLIGLAFMTITLVTIAAAPTYALLLGGFLAVGLATGVLHSLDRPTLSHLYPSRRGRVFNLLDMAWAIGAMLGPVLVVVVLFSSDWRAVYALLALAFVPLAALVWRLEVPDLGAERALSASDFEGLIRTPTVATMGGLLLLLSLVESGMFTWLPYYVAQSLPREVAALSLTIYLAAYVPGRFAFSVATARYDNLSLVLGSAAVATVLLVAFVLLGGYAMLAAVFVVGFLVAGMFPTLLAWATNVAPEHSGPVNAIAMGVSGVGFMVFPAAMGFIAERFWLDVAMGLLPVAMGLFVLLAGVIKLGPRLVR